MARGDALVTTTVSVLNTVGELAPARRSLQAVREVFPAHALPKVNRYRATRLRPSIAVNGSGRIRGVRGDAL